MKGFMYILQCSNGQYYTGSTNNLEFRLAQHKNGEGANFTKKHLPVELVYYEEFSRIDLAFYREKQVQGWSRKKKEALINGQFAKLHDFSECKNETHFRSDLKRVASASLGHQTGNGSLSEAETTSGSSPETVASTSLSHREPASLSHRENETLSHTIEERSLSEAETTSESSPETMASTSLSHQTGNGSLSEAETTSGISQETVASASLSHREPASLSQWEPASLSHREDGMLSHPIEEWPLSETETTNNKKSFTFQH